MFEGYTFDLIETDTPGTYHFSFKCSVPFCDNEYEADIDKAYQLRLCKAYIASHAVSHLRPF